MSSPAKDQAMAEWSAASKEIDRIINVMCTLNAQVPVYRILNEDLKDAIACRRSAGDRLAAAALANLERRKAAAAVAVAV